MNVKTDLGRGGGQIKVGVGVRLRLGLQLDEGLKFESTFFQITKSRILPFFQKQYQGYRLEARGTIL